MSVVKTNVGNTKIKCLNMESTNNTLFIIPDYNGERISYMIFGKQIAKEIMINNNLKNKIFNKAVRQHNLYRTLLSC